MFRVQLCATPLDSKHYHLNVFVIVNHEYTAHLFIECCRKYDLASITCHPTPSILAQHCGSFNISPPIVLLAQEISSKKRRFNWANVSSKPTYVGWATKSPRRAHT